MMEPVAYLYTGGGREPEASARKFQDITIWAHNRTEEPLVRLSDAEARIKELDEEIGRLEDENSDLRCEPWPEWARAVLKVVRKHSGYDGYDDATEGVDMPLELSEHLSQMEAEAGRWKARAEAAEALLKEAGEALEPFVAEANKWAKETSQVHFADDDTIALHIKGNVCGFCGEEPGCDVAAFNVGHLRAARAIHHKIGVKDE